MGIIFCAVFYEFRTENGDAKKPIQYRHADISKNISLVLTALVRTCMEVVIFSAAIGSKEIRVC